jgi:hypothetical protein
VQFKLSKRRLILLVIACLVILYLVFVAIGVVNGSTGVSQ